MFLGRDEATLLRRVAQIQSVSSLVERVFPHICHNNTVVGLPPGWTEGLFVPPGLYLGGLESKLLPGCVPKVEIDLFVEEDYCRNQ